VDGPVYDGEMTSPGAHFQRAEFDAEVRRIRAMSDPFEAYRAAGMLIERHAEFRGLAAALRAEQAQRAFEAAQMSITQFAERLGITKQRAATLLQRARDTPAGLEPFSETAAGGLTAMQEDVRTLEATARVMRHFQFSHVPGLLQTREYARSVLRLALLAPPDDVDEALAVRMARQEILGGEGRAFEFILAESALRWLPEDAPPGLLAAQLRHIAEVSELPDVAVGIIPQGAAMRTLPVSPFIIYDERDEGRPPFVIVELAHAAIYASRPEDVDLYRERLRLLRLSALTGDAARGYLATLTG
jgi:hypothetical protein